MRATAIVVLTLLAAAPALADHIGLYTDPSGSSCVGPLEFPPVTNTVYVIHENGVGALASKWRIGYDLAIISVSFALTNPYLSINPIGDPLATGTTVSYLACRAAPYVIGSVGFLYFGAVQGCDHLRVVAHMGDAWNDAETAVVYADCAGVEGTATGGGFSLQSPGAMCGGCTNPVPVASATWGAVKALYR